MTRIVPPTERTCERCGRVDSWDEEVGQWMIAEDDGDRRTGTPYCLHEWDINGTYSPVDGRA